MDGFTAFLTTAGMQELERSRMPEPKRPPLRRRPVCDEFRPFTNNAAGLLARSAKKRLVAPRYGMYHLMQFEAFIPA